MLEKILPTPDQNHTQQIADFKAKLLRHQLPDTYPALIRDARFMLSPQNFSRHLSGALSNESLFSEDEYQRKSPRNVIEIEMILTRSSTEFGNTFKNHVRGKEFVDLASGTPHDSLTRAIAEAVGANRYFGVDSELTKEEIKIDESGKGGKFQAVYIKDDALSFVAKMERPKNGVVFYISGLEPVTLLDPARRDKVVQQNPQAAEDDLHVRMYIDACLKELARVTQTGDVIVIGQGTHGFEPQNYGFKLKSQKEHHFIYEKI